MQGKYKTLPVGEKNIKIDGRQITNRAIIARRANGKSCGGIWLDQTV